MTCVCMCEHACACMCVCMCTTVYMYNNNYLQFELVKTAVSETAAEEKYSVHTFANCSNSSIGCQAMWKLLRDKHKVITKR